MKKILLYFVAIFLSCSGNDRDSKKGFQTFLDKDYDFILGFAVPDEDRYFPTEVFVGRLLAQVPDTLLAESVLDTFMRVQVLRWQNTYVASIAYHNDAEVKIISDDQEVFLTPVGNGSYRDVNDVLHIEPLKKYRLEVRRPGNRYYSDEVIVPGNIQALNISDRDTVDAYPVRNSSTANFCIALYPVVLNAVQLAYFYRARVASDGLGFEGLGYVHYGSLQANNLAAAAMYDTADHNAGYVWFFWETLAFDSLFSRFYQREGLGGNKDMFDFLDYWEDKVHVTERSSLDAHGATDVIGNFGAYNAVRFSFTVKGLKDSCLCTRIPPECP